MDKKYYIAANWKMNASLSFIDDYFSSLDSNSENSNEMIVCPPDIYLQSVIKTAPKFIKTGAQNISSHDVGAYTGECSGEMLADHFVQYVIIGHSERRQYHQESNEEIKLKIMKAIENGINPILCIGESKKERELDQTFDVINNQIRSVLDSDLLSKDINMLIAYEPIWAIGTGLTATPDMANDVHSFIHSIVSEMTSKSIPIIYGGSMKESNAKELLEMEHIHGGLIGGASLDASEFLNIYNIAEEIRNG
tara:strand:+ start:3170 stop:3922 length:753 start_codon:yes stop_codon:yes gene_type:complete